MSYIVIMRSWGILLGSTLLLCSVGLGLGAAKPLTAEEIINTTVSKSGGKSENGRANYTYTKVSITDQLDSRGNVDEHKEKVIRFKEGKGSVAQIKINGKPLSPEELRREQQQIMAEDAKVSDSSKMSRRSDNWEQLLTPELIARYTFRLEAEETINGRPTYVLSFRPAGRDLPVNQMSDRVMNELNGKLWIDAEDFEIAIADLWLENDVSLWGGFLGSLRKFDYHVERVRLEPGVWANRQTRGEFRGRKFLENMNVRTRSLCSDFQKAH